MSEQQWEYCELALVEWKDHKRGLISGSKEGRGYDCYVRYYNPAGGIYNKLSDTDQIIGFNPFYKALALLGINGWELVTMQFGNKVESGSAYYESGYIRWSNRVAYLKRPIVAGRNVDQPELVL